MFGGNQSPILLEVKEEAGKARVRRICKTGIVWALMLHQGDSLWRFLPKVVLILPSPSLAGSLAWHLRLSAKSQVIDLILCHTWVLWPLPLREEKAYPLEPTECQALDPDTKACLEGGQC